MDARQSSCAVFEFNRPTKIMEFRLTYDGPLPPDKQGMAPIKQAIRHHIHPQLRELINTHPEFKTDKTRDGWFGKRSFGKYNFESLVDGKHGLSCHLDILLLRRAKPGGLWSGGDIDNRIKNLIDGLRAPQQASEIPSEDILLDGENPFYCLLADDSLVTGFSVLTDRLLSSPHDKEDHYARVVLDVTIETIRWPWQTILFKGD